LIEEFFARRHEAQIVIRPEMDEPIGIGFEITVARTASFTGGYRTTWTERILAFSSFERARSEARRLDQAIERASQELLKLNERKQGKKCLDAEQTAEAAAEIVKRDQLEGIINFSLETEVVEREVRAWRDRPARTEREERHEVKSDVGVKLVDQLTVRPQQPHRHINPALLDNDIQILACAERDLIRMRLPTGQFAFDGLAGVKHTHIFVSLNSGFLRDHLLESKRTERDGKKQLSRLQTTRQK
jgi:hypothetical protein